MTLNCSASSIRRSRLRFDLAPSDYQDDEFLFQKIVFEGIGEIDFIVRAGRGEAFRVRTSWSTSP